MSAKRSGELFRTFEGTTPTMSYDTRMEIDWSCSSLSLEPPPSGEDPAGGDGSGDEKGDTAIMTAMTETDVRCVICSTLSRTVALSDVEPFGPPDLDLRPQGPARWALEFEVQRCAFCGYCARSLGEAPIGAQETVDSLVYRGVLERSTLPRLARTLFCSALVSERAGEPEQAGWHFLQAAWACDDKDAPEQARICRQRSAEMFICASETGEAVTPTPVLVTLAAELWRRAGSFEQAIDAATQAEHGLGAGADDDDSGAAAVAAFIRNLAESGDDDLHNTAEIDTDGDGPQV